MNHDVFMKQFEKYINDILSEYKDNPPKDLFTELFPEMEKTLIETVLKKTRWNQSKTAVIIGYSRNCVRIKLAQYFGNKYVGKSD